VPRKLRVEYAGALYHVTNRGNRGAAICEDDEDRTRFLATLSEAAAKTGWAVQAFCLLTDHFHLVLETPQPNLVAGMRWFLSTYTNRFNRRHHANGHVFAGRYRAVPIAPSGPFLEQACAHVHLNPARAGLLTPAQPLTAYPWNSFVHYLQPASLRPAWLSTQRLFLACQFADDPPGRRAFERAAEAQRQSPPPEAWASLRRGWYFGDDEFRSTLLGRLATDDQLIRHGVPPAELALWTAERIIADELARLGWTEVELNARPKAAPEKVDIAARLRRESVLSIRWIATRLRAGSPYTLRNALHARARAGAATAPAPAPASPRPPSPARNDNRVAVLPEPAGPPPPPPPRPVAGSAPDRGADGEPFSVAWD
jgi:REP element-mobilizing transposase RayT